MVIQLLPDVLDKIFFYCKISDLKNLSLTSSQYNTMIGPWVKHTVRIPPTQIPQEPDEENNNIFAGFCRKQCVTHHCEQLRKRLEHVNVLQMKFALTEHIPDYVLQVISFLGHLVVLDLTKSMSIDDSKFSLLCTDGLSGLKLLDITYTKVTDAGFKCIGQLKSLEELSCCHCNITNESLKHIAMLYRLRKLDLSNCVCITDVSIICSLKELEKLYLVYSRVTDEALSHIGELQSLKILDVQSCYQLNDASMIFVSELSSLIELDASVCFGLTDTSCKYIGKMSYLEKLSLRFTGITDEGLMSLHSLTKVKELNVRECRGITIKGLEILLDHVPSLIDLDVRP